MYWPLKFIYSEKATKLCKISILLLFYVVPVKSKVEISQNFVAFSEYKNFSCTPFRMQEKYHARHKFLNLFHQGGYFVWLIFLAKIYSNQFRVNDETSACNHKLDTKTTAALNRGLYNPKWQII